MGHTKIYISSLANFSETMAVRLSLAVVRRCKDGAKRFRKGFTADFFFFQIKMLIQVPSPRKTSIDKINDCAMKSERGGAR